jgi:WD40 repeat protein
MATASDDRTLEIRESTGKLLNTITGNERLTSVAFSYNDNLLAAACADKSISIWEIQGNSVKQLQKIVGHQDWVNDLAFSPDDRLLASASRDGTIRLWNKDGTAIATLTGHQGWVNKLAFSPKIIVEGRTLPYILASGSDDNTVKLWQVDNNGGKVIKTITQVGEGVTGIDLTVDRDNLNRAIAAKDSEILDIKPFLLLATASNDGVVKLWQDGTEIMSYPHNAPVNRVAFSPDGQLVGMALADGTIDVWDRSLNQQRTLKGHGGEVLSLSFQPLSTNSLQINKTELYTLASSSVDKTVKIWQIPAVDGSDLGGIYSIAVNPQNTQQFATAGWEGNIQLWQQNDRGDRVLIRNIPGETTISQIAYSPDGKLLAAANWNKTIELWDVATGTKLATLTGHQAGINSIAIDRSADSDVLVSGSEDKTVKIWQIGVNKNTLLHNLSGHQDSVKNVAISPDGKLIASGSYDQTIKLWDRDGKLQQTLTGHDLAVTSLVFSHDGRTLVSGSADNTIKLWQIDPNLQQPAHLTKTLTGHQTGVTSLAYYGDGNIHWLASASSDRTIKLWNVKTGTLLKTLQGHPSQINSIALFDRGNSLLSADEQKGLYWWNLNLYRSFDRGCDRLKDYLQSDSTLSQIDRSVCD